MMTLEQFEANCETIAKAYKNNPTMGVHRLEKCETAMLRETDEPAEYVREIVDGFIHDLTEQIRA